MSINDKLMWKIEGEGRDRLREGEKQREKESRGEREID